MVANRIELLYVFLSPTNACVFYRASAYYSYAGTHRGTVCVNTNNKQTNTVPQGGRVAARKATLVHGVVFCYTYTYLGHWRSW